MSAPELPHRCGSWVVVDIASGKPVAEFFNKNNADKASQLPQFEVVTTMEWLRRVNQAAREAQTA
jgi:hypothetical protein